MARRAFPPLGTDSGMTALRRCCGNVASLRMNSAELSQRPLLVARLVKPLHEQMFVGVDREHGERE